MVVRLLRLAHNMQIERHCLKPCRLSRLSDVQIETLFQAMQRSAKKPASVARQKLAVLDLKRATAVGIRMSRLRCSILP